MNTSGWVRCLRLSSVFKVLGLEKYSISVHSSDQVHVHLPLAFVEWGAGPELGVCRIQEVELIEGLSYVVFSMVQT